VIVGATEELHLYSNFALRHLEACIKPNARR
jgi:hypothetical protein